jgi:hypothetical protein
MYDIQIAGKAFLAIVFICNESNQTENKRLVVIETSGAICTAMQITVYYSTVTPMVYVIEKTRNSLWYNVYMYILYIIKGKRNLACALCCYICNLNIQNLAMKYLVLFIIRKHKYKCK